MLTPCIQYAQYKQPMDIAVYRLVKENVTNSYYCN